MFHSTRWCNIGITFESVKANRVNRFVEPPASAAWGVQALTCLRSATPLTALQADQVGSFFAKYPRFRQLISLNKPYTGAFPAVLRL